MTPLGFLRDLVRRATKNGKSPAGHTETEAQKSARKYWQREVADEKERRGTGDPRRKR